MQTSLQVIDFAAAKLSRRVRCAYDWCFSLTVLMTLISARTYRAGGIRLPISRVLQQVSTYKEPLILKLIILLEASIHREFR